MDHFRHILVVDDQRDIRESLSEHLSGKGFEVKQAADASKARRILRDQPIDLVVLDIMMPGEDGLSLCRYLRESLDMPVILLTALADDTDRIVGLELGADDYVTKPFNPRELVARIKSVLRRSQGVRAPTIDHGLFRFGHWQLDVMQCELRASNGVIVPLSNGEIKLLSVFAEHPNKVLSRDELIDLTRGHEALPFDRSIDNMVSRLRRKIESDPKRPKHIKTVWGGGYRFVVDPEST